MTILSYFLESLDESGNRLLVDTDRYIITEKPEWKVKKLKEEIESQKRIISNFSSQIDSWIKNKLNAEEKLKKLESELAELEKT